MSQEVKHNHSGAKDSDSIEVLPHVDAARKLIGFITNPESGLFADLRWQELIIQRLGTQTIERKIEGASYTKIPGKPLEEKLAEAFESGGISRMKAELIDQLGRTDVWHIRGMVQRYQLIIDFNL